jgi:Na+-driven multidrug efflux pump
MMNKSDALRILVSGFFFSTVSFSLFYAIRTQGQMRRPDLTEWLTLGVYVLLSCVIIYVFCSRIHTSIGYGLAVAMAMIISYSLVVHVAYNGELQAAVARRGGPSGNTLDLVKSIAAWSFVRFVINGLVISIPLSVIGFVAARSIHLQAKVR